MPLRCEFCLLGTVACLAAVLPAAGGEPLRPAGRLTVQGELKGNRDISAVAVFGRFLAIASDETSGIQVLERTGAQAYRVRQWVPLDPGGDEIDIEGMALDGNHLYVIGSHARNRKGPDEERTYKENRGRLEKGPAREKAREKLWRLDVNPETGAVQVVGSTSLRDALRDHAVLGKFAELGGKEGGPDVEGLAVQGGRLHAGLRGPVLRGEWAVVLSFRFDDPATNELAYLNLGGRGVRSLEAVRDGFLLIAGGVGQEQGPGELFFWDGRDTLPGAGGPGGRLVSLGVIPTPAGAGAEGLTVLEETDGVYRILIAYDGTADGDLTVFEVRRP